MRGRRNTFCTPMLFRVAGAVLSALVLFRVAGAVLCFTLRRLAAVGRRSSCVAGAILSVLRCCFAWQAQCSLHSGAVSRGRHSTLFYLAEVGCRGAAVFLRGRRNTFCTAMLFRVAGAVVCAFGRWPVLIPHIIARGSCFYCLRPCLARCLRMLRILDANPSPPPPPPQLTLTDFATRTRAHSTYTR